MQRELLDMGPDDSRHTGTARLSTDTLRALQALGYGVWSDDQLPAHRDYSEVIEERLRAAKAVVVLWSAEAVKSEWVQSEADRARGARKLVQLRLDGASLPMPFVTGSTTVSATAVAIAASTALPPLASMASPACAASGWLVATQLAARIGWRIEG